MYSLQQFKDFYFKYKKLPNGIYCKSKGKLSDSQLNSKYEKYIISENKKQDRFQKAYDKSIEKFQVIIDGNFESLIDEVWEKVKQEVIDRDGYKCSFYNSELFNSLDQNKKDEINKSLANNSELRKLDFAHIISRSQSSNLYYDALNLVCLYRFFHTAIDNFKDVVTGENINKEQRDNFWISLVGIDRWNYLQKNK